MNARTRTRVMLAVLVLCLGLLAFALAEGRAASVIVAAVGTLGAVVYLMTRRRPRAARDQADGGDGDDAARPS